MRLRQADEDDFNYTILHTYFSQVKYIQVVKQHATMLVYVYWIV